MSKADQAQQFGPVYTTRGHYTIWTLHSEHRARWVELDIKANGNQTVHSSNGDTAELPAGADPTNVINEFLEAL